MARRGESLLGHRSAGGEQLHCASLVFSWVLCLSQHYRSGENHFFLIKELAKYAVVNAYFVAFLIRSIQDASGKTKAASSDDALPCPLG